MRHAIRKHLRDFIAILGLVAIGLGTAAYILTEQRLRFPVVEEKPFIAEGRVLRRAGASCPARARPCACPACGSATSARSSSRTAARSCTMEIDKEFEDLVHSDATALLRPRTGLKDMFIAARPGHASPSR